MEKTSKQRMQYFKGQPEREDNVLEATLSTLMLLGVVAVCVVIMVIM